ncbi:MAG: hypothetical protein JWM87_3265 [Candidatus Eremiobacteraeota bacterium]|nr:hypothetical protein [Candidatus Eremiobacteraeota bacterium]
MSLWKHPGYFGITSQGVIAIHTDWPMYPEEHGADLALLWLTAFPAGTIFKGIDDIDQCVLFLAGPTKRDPFDELNYHVAIWHEDLTKLSRDGLVTGMESVTERAWEEARRRHRGAGPFYIEFNGRFKQIEEPNFDIYDDEVETWPLLSDDGITVSRLGRTRIGEFFAAVRDDDFKVLGERVPRLLALSYFDTAVREACVAIEHQIKTWLQSDRWGQDLIAEFVSRLERDEVLLNTDLRVVRSEVRTAFRFIRNEFAHNAIAIDEIECKAKLFRLARLKTSLDSITKATPPNRDAV